MNDPRGIGKTIFGACTRLVYGRDAANSQRRPHVSEMPTHHNRRVSMETQRLCRADSSTQLAPALRYSPVKCEKSSTLQ